jgi:hypothetical protein
VVSTKYMYMARGWLLVACQVSDTNRDSEAISRVRVWWYFRLPGVKKAVEMEAVSLFNRAIDY